MQFKVLSCLSIKSERLNIVGNLGHYKLLTLLTLEG